MSPAYDFFPHQNLSLETWIKKFGWVKLWKSQTLVWPRSGKTLNTKTAKFWYIPYILRLAKDQELKIVEAEYKILINILSKTQPRIRYILGDMIPPS